MTSLIIIKSQKATGTQILEHYSSLSDYRSILRAEKKQQLKKNKGKVWLGVCGLRSSQDCSHSRDRTAVSLRINDKASVPGSFTGLPVGLWVSLALDRKMSLFMHAFQHGTQHAHEHEMRGYSR